MVESAGKGFFFIHKILIFPIDLLMKCQKFFRSYTPDKPRGKSKCCAKCRKRRLVSVDLVSDNTSSVVSQKRNKVGLKIHTDINHKHYVENNS